MASWGEGDLQLGSQDGDTGMVAMWLLMGVVEPGPWNGLGEDLMEFWIYRGVGEDVTELWKGFGVGEVQVKLRIGGLVEEERLEKGLGLEVWGEVEFWIRLGGGEDGTE